MVANEIAGFGDGLMPGSSVGCRPDQALDYRPAENVTVAVE
jgi:hypothetical protein